VELETSMFSASGLSLISGVGVVIGWVAWWGSSFLGGLITFYVAVWRVERSKGFASPLK
jgi:hypothetical protein